MSHEYIEWREGLFLLLFSCVLVLSWRFIDETAENDCAWDTALRNFHGVV